MRRMKRIILPHEEHGHRSHALSHHALFAYCLLLFTFLITSHVLIKQTGLILGFATNIHTEDVYQITNRQREDAGLPALVINTELSAAAHKKAEDMFRDDYWSHIAPDGTTPWVFIEEEHYDYYYAGENLARDFDGTSAVVKAWMNSPTHRDNILGENYHDIGVAVVNGVLKGHETTLVVQFFGGKQTSTPVAAEKPPPATPISVETEATGEEGIPQVSPPILTAAETPVVAGARFSSYMHTSILLFATFLLSLFALDLVIVTKKGIRRISGSTLAHIALLLFLIFIAWWANVGVIL